MACRPAVCNPQTKQVQGRAFAFSKRSLMPDQAAALDVPASQASLWTARLAHSALSHDVPLQRSKMQLLCMTMTFQQQPRVQQMDVSTGPRVPALTLGECKRSAEARSAGNIYSLVGVTLGKARWGRQQYVPPVWEVEVKSVGPAWSAPIASVCADGDKKILKDQSTKQECQLP